MGMKKILFSMLFIAASSQVLEAASQVATLTRFYGNVKILTNPSQKPTGQKNTVLFEGKYFVIKKAKIGDRLLQGNVIQTAQRARARLVYDNGDQISVSPSSAYRIRWNINKKDSKPVIDVLFGKMRAVIKKRGPRAGMKIQTRSMVMGVRGTDFFVVGRGRKGGSEVSVLRGVVAVKPKAPKSKTIEIPTGYSAEIKAPPPSKEKPKTKVKKGEKTVKQEETIVDQPVISLQKTSKQELVLIQKASVVSKKKSEKVENKKASKLIAKLEKQAVKTTLEDIKEEDPTLYAEISKKPEKLDDVDQLTTKTVKKLFKDAPLAPKNIKPGENEFKDIDIDNAYEKYFKID